MNYEILHVLLHRSVTGLLLFLICCCIIRQRRYWRELQSNRPSSSVRVGFKLATAAAIMGAVIAAIVNTPEGWKVFGAVVLMLCFFCVKISFSPAILALTLALMTLNHEMTGAIHFMDVWMAVATAVMWRFPEEVRAVYATISFIWVLASFMRTTEAGSAQTVAELNPLVDSVS